MQEHFDSLNECLNYWEFCPMCNDRLRFIIKGEKGFYKTIITNRNLVASKVDGNEVSEVLNIDLATNQVLLHHKNIDNNLQLYIDCKDMGMRTGYGLCLDNGVAKLDIEYMDARVSDRKRKFSYHLISYYKDDQTTIYIEDARDIKKPTWSKVDSELLHLTNLDKKHLLKTIRGYCLLM